jgi:hypothetical protein
MFVKGNLIRTTGPAASIFALAVTNIASAQNVDITSLQRQPAVREAMNACIADRNRLCADVLPGGGRIVRCLASRSQDLSAICRSHLEKARDALIAAGIAINADQVQPPK